MTTKICLTFIAILIWSNCVFSQKSLLGTRSDDLNFEKVLNDQQKNYNLSDFKGKIILLDFWATWCAPCIQSFPEMENLQKEFPNDLKIISITSDGETRINKFLAKFKTSLPIVIDSLRILAEKFPHNSIPHSILIDKQGIIRAVTSSSQIDKTVIQKLINAENLDILEKIDSIGFDPRKNTLSETPNVLGQITLTPFKKAAPSMSTRFRNGRMSFINLLPSTIYESLHNYPNVTRTIWEADKLKYQWKEENLYCLEIIAPNKTDIQAKKMLIDYLHNQISLKSKIGKQKMAVKILKKIDKNMQLTSADQNQKSFDTASGSGFEMRNLEMTAFATYLEERLNVPVLDQTGLVQKYDLQIDWYNENPKQVYEDLKKLGFELVDSKKEIEVLIFYEKD